jgi:Ca2+-binding RTX toxin-like protein
MIIFGTHRSGTERINGTNGDDILSGYFPGEESTDTSVDHIYGYAGYDNLFGGLRGDWLYGGEDDDNLTGGPGADHLYGGDRHHDSGAHDRAWYNSSPAGVTVNLHTGSGHGGDAQGDVLSGIENVVGSNFDDIIIGSSVANVLEGGGGIDALYGRGGRDLLYGDAGDDYLDGGAGADHLDGGRGLDTADYRNSPDHVLVDLDSGTGQYGDAEGDTLLSIENVTGSNHADIIYGNDGGNVLEGLAGRDLLFGLGGNDSLFGGPGDDLLSGGVLADHLDGGHGSDTAGYFDSAEGVQVNLEVGLGFSGEALGDVLVDVENIFGSLHDDVLVGDDEANVFEGVFGDDYLVGGGGSDHLFGGIRPFGPDSVIGDADPVHFPDGHDTLIGGRGADELTGGTGADRLTGGRDADTFIWTSMDDTGVTLETMDFITDFNRREGDRIDLRPIDANPFSSAPGDQAFTFIGTDAFSSRATPSGEVPPGLIRYYNDGTDTFIALNTNALPDDDAVIRIHGVQTVDASWFLP